MGLASVEDRLHRAEHRVRQYLAHYGAELPPASIIVDPGLEEGSLATHRYPATVVVREASVPESIIAHELVHVAQGTLEQFRGFRLLYVLLAEGLAEWVTKVLYTEHDIKYRAGYRLMELLVAADEKCVRDVLRLHDLNLTPEDVDAILVHPRLPQYSRSVLTRVSDRIRESVRTAIEAGITDPTFVTLGEEVRAWKFLLSVRFESLSAEVDEVLREWFSAAV